MFARRLFADKRLYYCLVPSGLVSSFDDKFHENSKTGQEMLRILQDEHEKMTGWERLYYLYTFDEFGAPTPELNLCLQSVFLSCLVGVGWGGFVRSKNAFNNFMQFNQATQFLNHLDAKRKIQDTVTIAFFKGAMSFAWRLSAFTGSYMFISTSIAAYRGKSGIREHSIAGLVTGIGYKISLGVRGVIVGGVLGLFLGTVSGTMITLVLKLCGLSMTDIYRMNYHLRMDRTQVYQMVRKKHLEDLERTDQNAELIDKHKQKYGEEGVNINLTCDNDTKAETPTVIKQESSTTAPTK